MAWRTPFPPSRMPASIAFSIKLFVCLSVAHKQHIKLWIWIKFTVLYYTPPFWPGFAQSHLWFLLLSHRETLMLEGRASSQNHGFNLPGFSAVLKHIFPKKLTGSQHYFAHTIFAQSLHNQIKTMGIALCIAENAHILRCWGLAEVVVRTFVRLNLRRITA